MRLSSSSVSTATRRVCLHNEQTLHKNLKIRGVRGYTLPVVLALTALLAVSLGILFNSLVASSRASGDMLRRRKSFYACDGLSRAVVAKAQSYMAGDTTPTGAEMKTFIGDVTSLLPTGYVLDKFEIDTIGASRASEPLPSGPFKGMNARLDDIKMELEASHSVHGYRCSTEQEISLGKIALFQFYVFGDTYFDGHPGPTMTLNGRAHVNYNACPGGNIRASQITVAGNLWAGDSGSCEYRQWNSMTIKDGGGNDVRLTTSNDANSSNWRTNALSTWDGNALDQAHDVPKLRPPVIGDPITQLGANARDARNEESLNQTGTQYASESNNQNLRFLVDPVRPADAEDVKNQKFSWLADVRIINGTWYRNNGSFPGDPIWSDHPGSFTLANSALGLGISLAGTQVGQANIMAAKGLAAPPMRYSLYSYDSASGAPTRLSRGFNGSRVSNAPPATISYGTVKRMTTPSGIYTSQPYWKSASWVTEELCRTTGGSPHVSVNLQPYFSAAGVSVPPALTSVLGSPPLLSFARSPANDGQSSRIASNGFGVVSEPTFPNDIGRNYLEFNQLGNTRLACTGGAGIGAEDVILNATRGGFFDGHRGGHYGGMDNTPYRAQVLPVNFDIEAFQNAMTDTSAGELGSYFAGGDTFNGIVWISYPYPGSLNGLGSSSGRADVRVANMQGDATLYGQLPSGSIGTDGSYGSRPLIYGRRNPSDASLISGWLPASISDAVSSGVPGVGIAGDLSVAASQARVVSSADFRPSMSSAQDVFATHVPADSGAPSHFTQNHYATTQNELPFPLCTNDPFLVGTTTRLIGNASPHRPFGSSSFHVSRCQDYYSGYNTGSSNYAVLGRTGAWITGVRIMNGRNLDAGIFKKGLSIVTNMPTYIMGDMNNDSTPHNGDLLPASASGDWIPLLLGGDVMYHLSNAWDDNRASWNNYSRAWTRPAVDTTFNIAELIGWVPSKSGVGGTRFHNLQGYLETWNSDNHNINGSVAIGWKAVYNRNNRTSGGRYAYSPPSRNWTFDTNYRFFSNQPPGTPTFDVAATRKFTRD